MPVSTVSLSASSFATGNTPGMPRQIGQTFVFGAAPNSFAHPHHIFERVLSCTCVSRPMTASYSMSKLPAADGRAFLMPRRRLLVSVREFQNRFFAKRLAQELQPDRQLRRFCKSTRH